MKEKDEFNLFFYAIDRKIANLGRIMKGGGIFFSSLLPFFGEKKNSFQIFFSAIVLTLYIYAAIRVATIFLRKQIFGFHDPLI